jgi:hypothetical protein
MSAAALIDLVLNAGGEIRADGLDLVLNAPRSLPDDLLEQLKLHKPDIVKALGQPRGTVPGVASLGDIEMATITREAEDLKEHFEERAGILGCAGLPKAEAELEAARSTTTLARNRGYAWASLRAALVDHPELLVKVPTDGSVDVLVFGVPAVHVRKDRVLWQGEFTGAHEAVRCCDCRSFVPDAIGDGLGAGRCSTDGEGSRPEGRWQVRSVLWARAERRCGDWAAIEPEMSPEVQEVKV